MKKIVVLLSALVALAACGSTERPTQEEVSKALQDKDNPAAASFASADFDKEVLDCIADVLHKSDLSSDALKALVDGDEEFRGTDDDEKAITAVQTDLIDCSSA